MAIGNSSISTLIEKAKNKISTLADEKYYNYIFRKNDFLINQLKMNIKLEGNYYLLYH